MTDKAEPKAVPAIEIKIGIIRGQLASILNGVGGLESNIRYPSPYWFLQNQLKSLLRQL